MTGAYDFQERRRLEEQYSTGLRKLARRSPPGDSMQDLGYHIQLQQQLDNR